MNGVLLTGAQDGGLIKWNGTSAGRPIKKHTDAIWSIERSGDDLFLTGSNDGKIMVWNAQMQVTTTIDLNGMVQFMPGIRSMDVSDDGKLLVGTRGADVIELDNNGNVSRFIVQGHF